VEYHDPLVPRFREHGLDLASVPLTAERLDAADLVLILTDHTAVDYGLVVQYARLVLDTRNATRGLGCDRERVVLL